MRQPPRFPGLREGVRRFFAFEADHARPSAVAGAATDPPPPLVSTGRFGLIGLEELRRVVGPRWEALEERVRALAEAVIVRQLTSGDVFERQEDGSYVILFARLSQEAAEFKCRVIGREITERLLGSDLPGLADVETISAHVPRDALSGADVEQVLAQAFAAAEATVSSDPGSPRAHVPAQTGLESLRPIEHDAVLQARLPAWRDLDARPPSVISPAVPIEGSRTPRAELVWRYSPIWDVKNMSLVRFRLTSGDRSALDSTGPDGVGFDMDLRALSKALDDLASLGEQGRRLSVICTLHESSLGVQWRRDQIVELLSAAPAEVRRLLTLELLAPSFVVRPAVTRFIEALRPTRIRCGICVPVGIRPGPSKGKLASAAMDAQGCSSESDALAALTIFARDCADAELDSAAHGLATRSLVLGAIGAGVRLLSGHAVRADLDDLSRGLRFEPADLYRDLMLTPPH